jgi:starvation-inducible DNA-binding protein
MSNRAPHLHALNATQVLRTSNDLPAHVRHASIEMLNRNVVHAIDVALSAKHAHWNVRGPSFLVYHQLFEKVFTQLLTQIDSLGERTTALGGIARATVQAVARETDLKPYPVLSVSEQEHIEELAQRLGRLGGELRRASLDATRSEDVVTADVLIQAGAAVDALLWLVESHLARA